MVNITATTSSLRIDEREMPLEGRVEITLGRYTPSDISFFRKELEKCGEIPSSEVEMPPYSKYLVIIMHDNQVERRATKLINSIRKMKLDGIRAGFHYPSADHHLICEYYDGIEISCTDNDRIAIHG